MVGPTQKEALYQNDCMPSAEKGKHGRADRNEGISKHGPHLVSSSKRLTVSNSKEILTRSGPRFKTGGTAHCMLSHLSDYQSTNCMERAGRGLLTCASAAAVECIEGSVSSDVAESSEPASVSSDAPGSADPATDRVASCNGKSDACTHASTQWAARPD